MYVVSINNENNIIAKEFLIKEIILKTRKNNNPIQTAFNPR